VDWGGGGTDGTVTQSGPDRMSQAVCPCNILREQGPGKLPDLSKRVSNVTCRSAPVNVMLIRITMTVWGTTGCFKRQVTSNFMVEIGRVEDRGLH
jgi:hypothetical protein